VIFSLWFFVSLANLSFQKRDSETLNPNNYLIIKMKNIVLVSILVICLFNSALADLPVHCLKHHAVGEWTFKISTPTLVEDPYKMNCGHKSPDDPAESYLAMHNQFQPTQSFNIHLKDDDSVISNTENGFGSWTMIYDEGMDVQFNDHRFTAFFYYFPDNNGKVTSFCGKTVVGWYIEKSTGKKACFQAEKNIKSEDEKNSLYVAPLTQMYVVQPKDTYSVLAQQKTGKKHLRAEVPQAFSINKDYTNHEEFVHQLNTQFKKSWTAAVSPSFQGKTLGQLNKLAGRKKPISFRDGTYERASLKNSFIQKSDLSGLPREWSWAEYLPPVREQRECGSCYIFATLAMIETRLKIKYGESVTLSPQHVIDCSFHNQGCEGGYPFLVEKFANEFELVPESCSPYKGVDGRCQTCDTSKLDKVYKVKDYK